MTVPGRPGKRRGAPAGRPGTPGPPARSAPSAGPPAPAARGMTTPAGAVPAALPGSSARSPDLPTRPPARSPRRPWPPLRPRRPSRSAELEHGPVSRAQLADVAGYAGPYRAAHPLVMNGERQPAAAERDQDRGLAELHGE